MKLGNLEWFPLISKVELVSKSTLQAAKSLPDVLIAEIDPALSDTAAFCDKYQVAANICANCVIVQAKRAEETWYAAIVVPAQARADINGIVRRELNARKISFAPMERVVELSAMEFGAINPIGLPDNWPILVDSQIAKQEHAVIGSGVRSSKLLVSGRLLASLPHARVLKLTKD